MAQKQAKTNKLCKYVAHMVLLCARHISNRLTGHSFLCVI